MVGSHNLLLPETLEIERHKAAIARNDLSKPVRLALEANLFNLNTTFFDYGCGLGGDVKRVASRGYISNGWDPYYRPETIPATADIVNIGYIINVIESQAERREALIKAWAITRQVLIVAAQVLVAQGNSQIAYGDGIVTSRNTFQKYYDQTELKTYIDQVLEVDAIPVSLGVYFVFRDESQAERFRASRFRSRTTTPRVRVRSKRFEDYQEILTPLMAFVTERGRLPVTTELTAESELVTEFGSLRRAFQVILQATDPQEWEAISEKRRQDLKVYLALTKFGHRPKIGALESEVQNDIKALFGNYKQACTEADEMLFSLGDLSRISTCCRQSKIGKRLPDSLYIHVSALENLDPLLRLYEGCASRTIGRMENATLIKFHTAKPKISYLVYPDFETAPHPALQTSMQIDLRDLHVTYRDYDTIDNPPILHRKETFIAPDNPLYEKFAKLTQQEEAWGLLDHSNSIGTRKQWQRRLEENCAELRGHRVIWRKDADPYQVKILRSAQRSRKTNGSNSPLVDE
jgi:DNA phosphorothioation-associated putative methyltransferase